jgi:hypothetical protein
MSKHDEYRRNADEAQRQADRAKNEDDRAAWLRLVQGWLALLPKRRSTATEIFDAETKARGTHQDDSKSSH